LDEVAKVDNLGKVSGRGRRLGQKLSKSAIDDLVNFLKKQGSDFEIFPINGSHEIKNFIGSSGKTLIFEKGKQAAPFFVTDKVLELLKTNNNDSKITEAILLPITLQIVGIKKGITSSMALLKPILPDKIYNNLSHNLSLKFNEIDTLRDTNDGQVILTMF
jgi:hypothetical protein